jgi:hypothetical protein
MPTKGDRKIALPKEISFSSWSHPFEVLEGFKIKVN